MRALSSLAALLLVIAAQFLPPALAVLLQDRDVSATSCWVHWAHGLALEREQQAHKARDTALPKAARTWRKEE